MVGLAVHLESKPLVGEERCQIPELGPLPGVLDGHPVHVLDPGDRRELLLRAGRSDGTAHYVPLAQPELAHLAGRHVTVLLSGEKASHPQEAVALGKDVQDAFTVLEICLVPLLLLASTAAAPAPLASVASP